MRNIIYKIDSIHGVYYVTDDRKIYKVIHNPHSIIHEYLGCVNSSSSNYIEILVSMYKNSNVYYYGRYSI